MRSLFVALAGASMLVACTFNATGITASSSNTADDTTGTTTTASSTTGDDPQPTSGATTGGLCVPGEVSTCACPVGVGEHTCFPNGLSYGPCDCPDPTTSSTTAVDPDTTHGATTTTTQDPSTTTTTTGDESTSSTTSDDTTSSSSTTSDDTTSSTTSDDTTTNPDNTTGLMCVQADVEPNDVVADAADHPEEGCNDDGASFMGALETDQDIDWHTFHGAFPINPCTKNNTVDPRLEFKLTADPQIRLCVFVNCDEGGPDIQDLNCMDGAMGVNSPQDGEGCCSVNDFRMDMNCMGVDNESAQMNLRLDGGKPDMCLPYTVSYDYIDKP